MKPVKIIFFDIDGTLVDPATRSIPESTREALRRLRQKGILLCVATGRPTASLPDFGDLRFDAYCTFNGSLCFAGEQVLHSHPLTREDAAQIMKNAAALGRPVAVATRHRLDANGVEPDLADYYRLANLELHASPDFDTLCREDIYQIMLGCRPEDHEAILQGTQQAKIAVSWDRAVDVIPAGSGKGSALGKILDHFRLDAGQALAFGDSYNDLEMLQLVGTAVVMGNAPAALKAIADEVCGHVSQDGIYRYCAEHGLI